MVTHYWLSIIEKTSNFLTKQRRESDSFFKNNKLRFASRPERSVYVGAIESLKHYSLTTRLVIPTEVIAHAKYIAKFSTSPYYITHRHGAL